MMTEKLGHPISFWTKHRILSTIEGLPINSAQVLDILRKVRAGDLRFLCLKRTCFSLDETVSRCGSKHIQLYTLDLDFIRSLGGGF